MTDDTRPDILGHKCYWCLYMTGPTYHGMHYMGHDMVNGQPMTIVENFVLCTECHNNAKELDKYMREGWYGNKWR